MQIMKDNNGTLRTAFDCFDYVIKIDKPISSKLYSRASIASHIKIR